MQVHKFFYTFVFVSFPSCTTCSTSDARLLRGSRCCSTRRRRNSRKVPVPSSPQNLCTSFSSISVAKQREAQACASGRHPVHDCAQQKFGRNRRFLADLPPAPPRHRNPRVEGQLTGSPVKLSSKAKQPAPSAARFGEIVAPAQPQAP